MLFVVRRLGTHLVGRFFGPIMVLWFLVLGATGLQRRIVTARRRSLERPLQDFVDELRGRDLTRVPGTADLPHASKEATPLALRANVEFNHVLHEQFAIVSVRTENVPYVPADRRIHVDELVYTDDGICLPDERTVVMGAHLEL
ncbi:MAG: KUP/HAK/KT family potassium transporter [Actinomycetota bacterium]|nr:KUP/HAK/KT family potassium transporter [Actinomycetota bacterium]